MTLLSLYLVLLIFVIARLLSGGGVLLCMPCVFTHAQKKDTCFSLSLSLSDFSISLCPHLNPFLFWAIGRRIQFIKSIILNKTIINVQLKIIQKMNSLFI